MFHIMIEGVATPTFTFEEIILQKKIVNRHLAKGT